MMTARSYAPQVEAFEPQLDGGTLHDQRIRAMVWATLIFWVSSYVLATVATVLNGRGHIEKLILIRIGEMILGLAFCYVIHRLLQRLPTAKKRLIALAIVAPIFAEVFAWVAILAEATIYPGIHLKYLTWSGGLRTNLQTSWLFLAWAGIYLTISYSFDLREEQQRNAELRERAHVAQLRALHSQINPHFLFNSLNSVSALMLDGKVTQADEMVTKLSQFLRLGLAADPTQKIPLSKEMELQQTYLELEQLRYEDLQVSFVVPEELLKAQVPALILQPIVENSIKHGVASAPPPAAIYVKAWASGRRLHLEVLDSGKGQMNAKSGGGIGLSNVLKRLRLVYGEGCARVDARRLEGGGFRVELAFPLEFK